MEMAFIKLYRMQLAGLDTLSKFMADPSVEFMDITRWDSNHPSSSDLYTGEDLSTRYCVALVDYIGHWFGEDAVNELYDIGYSMYELTVAESGLRFDYAGQTLITKEQVTSMKELSLAEIPVLKEDGAIDHELSRFVKFTMFHYAARKRREAGDGSIENASVIDVGMPASMLSSCYKDKRDFLLTNNNLPTDITHPCEHI